MTAPTVAGAGAALLASAEGYTPRANGTLDMATNTERWLFLGFFFAFAVKAPMVPFHTWLPDAGAEAPATVTRALEGAGFEIVEEREGRVEHVQLRVAVQRRGQALPLGCPSISNRRALASRYSSIVPW